MGVFSLKPASWCIDSKSDPRWDSSGRTEWLVCFGLCPEAEAAIEELKKQYGEPPVDLEYAIMKD
jgi:hypothetical protein